MNTVPCPFYTALSPIHGRGLFTNQYFPVGTVLFKVTGTDGKVTSLGQWVNHSWRPNIILHQEDGEHYAVASMPIYAGREIVGNYQFSPDCFEKPSSQWN